MNIWRNGSYVTFLHDKLGQENNLTLHIIPNIFYWTGKKHFALKPKHQSERWAGERRRDSPQR